MNYIKEKLRDYRQELSFSGKWILIAIIVGVVLGFVGTLFYWCMSQATSFRLSHPWMIFLLPFSGLLIVWLYRVRRVEKDEGTNLVIESVRAREELPVQMAPLIFIATIITHLFGGSAGREGAALQIGGSIGNGIGRLLHLNKNDRSIITMCGMSAAFSAIFGTPLAASIFSIEVISVGIMQYSALVPCVISALIAHGIATSFLDQSMGFEVTGLPAFGVRSAILAAVLAALCALISILFCVVLHQSEKLYRKIFRNSYLRVAAGGCFVLLITLLLGTQDYNGVGLTMMQESFHQSEPFYAFLCKILLTALTLGAGFKGGEIVPSFFIGAVFGSFFSAICGLPVSLCAAIGLGSVFCGVTNCPITSLLICFELFGFQGMPYYMLAIAISYMLSGYFGLYRSQRIMYSKYRADYVNKKAE